MNAGDKIRLEGYDLVGTAQCDYGVVLVLNNNSTHYIVVESETGGTDGPDAHGRYIVQFNPTGTVHALFAYDGARGSAPRKYREALNAMTQRALDLTSDDDYALDACPGCGCRPGDGVTKTCTHPDGCGAFKESV